MTTKTITIKAVINDALGTEIFRSVHFQVVPASADDRTLFADFVPPLERILSDAHKAFCPTPDEIAESLKEKDDQ